LIGSSIFQVEAICQIQTWVVGITSVQTQSLSVDQASRGGFPGTPSKQKGIQMLLNYISSEWPVQAIFVITVGVLLLSALVLRKSDVSEQRIIQREREREMIVEMKKLPKT
jgi:hypothetical protein